MRLYSGLDFKMPLFDLTSLDLNNLESSIINFNDLENAIFLKIYKRIPDDKKEYFFKMVSLGIRGIGNDIKALWVCFNSLSSSNFKGKGWLSLFDVFYAYGEEWLYKLCLPEADRAVLNDIIENINSINNFIDFVLSDYNNPSSVLSSIDLTFEAVFKALNTWGLDMISKINYLDNFNIWIDWKNIAENISFLWRALFSLNLINGILWSFFLDLLSNDVILNNYLINFFWSDFYFKNINEKNKYAYFWYSLYVVVNFSNNTKVLKSIANVQANATEFSYSFPEITSSIESYDNLAFMKTLENIWISEDNLVL